MAILFAGIVMSHYTHHNLSPVTQILMQQTLRTVAFMCGQRSPHFLQQVSLYSVSLMSFFCLYVPETCVFAFLGLSIFSFPHKFEISFVIWCIVGAPSLFKNASLTLNPVVPGNVSVSLSAGSGSPGTSGEHLPSVLPAELLQRSQDHPQNDVHHVV